MKPWIVVAAIALFGVLLRFLRGKPRLGPPATINVTIFVSGSPGGWKAKQRPNEFEARKNDSIHWNIQFEKGTEGLVVSLRNFKHREHPEFPDPFEGPVAERKTKPSSPKRIKDKVKGGAEKGRYTYDIYLGDDPALDPEIMIKGN